MAGLIGHGDILFSLYNIDGKEIYVFDNDIADEHKVEYTIDNSEDDPNTIPNPAKYSEWIWDGSFYVPLLSDDDKNTYHDIILSTNPNYFLDKSKKTDEDCASTEGIVWRAGTKVNLDILKNTKSFAEKDLAFYKRQCQKCYKEKKHPNNIQCVKIIAIKGGLPINTRKTKSTKKRTKSTKKRKTKTTKKRK